MKRFDAARSDSDNLSAISPRKVPNADISGLTIEMKSFDI